MKTSTPTPPANELGTIKPPIEVAREIVTGWLAMFDPPPAIDFQQSELLQNAISAALQLDHGLIKSRSTLAGKRPVDPAPMHASDCAVHNEPAYPNGPCDCGVTLNSQATQPAPVSGREAALVGALAEIEHEIAAGFGNPRLAVIGRIVVDNWPSFQALPTQEREQPKPGERP